MEKLEIGAAGIARRIYTIYLLVVFSSSSELPEINWHISYDLVTSPL